MKKYIFTFIILLSFTSLNYSQIRDYELGSVYSSGKARQNIYGGLYDYSDPEAVNITVSVWGFVKYPGRYIVPDYTTIIDLLSYVGGPTQSSNLDELRIYRINDNNQEQMIPIDYNDLMWEDGLDSKYRKVPTLKRSDILVVPGESRMYFTDWLSLGFRVVSALSILATLYITVQNY